MRDTALGLSPKAVIIVALAATVFLSSAAFASQVEQRPYMIDSGPGPAKNDPGWKMYLICEDRYCNRVKGLKTMAVKPREMTLAVKLSREIPLPLEVKVAPPVPPDPEPAEKEKTTPIHTVLFGFNSNTVTRKAKEALIRRTKHLKHPVSLKGFSCDLGSQKYNDDLALRRAKEVARLLVGKGMTVDGVSGEGKCCYVSPEKRLNRRVEVTTQKKKGGQ